MIQPMRSLLNADDFEKDTLTERWLDAKLDELRFVGITGALVGATVTGAVTWDHISGSVPIIPAFWYSSLLLALSSLSLATQQGVTLRRLSSHRDGFRFVRRLLGRPTKQQEELFEPRLAQLYVWQTPVMLLNFSIVLAVLGLAVLLVDKARTSGWAGPDMQVRGERYPK
ncbi:hypothetical protein MMC32_005162 [Xylographa parallela]|nr:hypothetical protein [Xylographa parallela]